MRPSGSAAKVTPELVARSMRQAGFDRPQPGVVGVLGGADRAVEPLIIGDIEHELGFGRIGAEIARKDRLVADQRDEGRARPAGRQAVAIARGPAIGAGDELVDAEQLPEAGEGQVFAERHEVRLVVAGDDLAIGVDGEDGIVAGVVGVGLVGVEPARAGRR